MVDLAFLALNGAVAYSGFLPHRAHEATPRPALWCATCFVLLSIGAIVSMFATLFWEYHPQWPALLAPASLLSILILGRNRWNDGVPTEYRSDK